MPHKIATTFAADGKHGQQFMDQLPWDAEFKTMLLQQRFIENKTGATPTLASLSQSYGHAFTTAGKEDVHEYLNEEAKKDVTTIQQELSVEFLAMNDPSKTFTQRLAIWKAKGPGFIMALYGGYDSTVTGIGCISSPACTTLDSKDMATHGDIQD
mmetsp:Transcript_19007/g.47068  ORF Transcript_19007/g.47068 Transcript_19007/m.47068 type:complete len:155 (+) Transcript_19007:91-555(+)